MLLPWIMMNSAACVLYYHDLGVSVLQMQGLVCEKLPWKPKHTVSKLENSLLIKIA